MTDKKTPARAKVASVSSVIAVMLIVVFGITLFSQVMLAVPSGPSALEYVSNSSRNTSLSAKSHTADRSTITTVRLNVSSQTLKWKAYVGNISGKFVLDDALNYTIYDWEITNIDGEVYGTRKSTAVTWESIRCAQYAHLVTEQSALQHSQSADDSLNRTFINDSHTGFSVGAVTIGASSCNNTVWLRVNDTIDTATWSEVALYDSSNLVFATVINASKQGYRNNNFFDFQMLLPENGSSLTPLSIPYYFYVELS